MALATYCAIFVGLESFCLSGSLPSEIEFLVGVSESFWFVLGLRDVGEPKVVSLIISTVYFHRPESSSTIESPFDFTIKVHKF